MTEEKIKHIVRIVNTDVRGNQEVVISLSKIKGVGHMFANMTCKLAGVDRHKKSGLLTETEIKRLEEVIKNPVKNNVPSWMLNRQEDVETGEDMHLITGDLQFTNAQDVRRLQKIKSYKGFRHAAGLPLRGQRTKSNFRRNKGKAVGVKKKSGAKSGRV